MNYSTYRFTLDIHKTKSQVSIPVLFQDTGVQFYINLTDGGKPYHIAEGCNAVLYAKKPKQNQDGTFDCLIHDCDVVNDGTRIVYKFTDQTTTQLGSVACEIRLYSADGKLLTTPAFEILVEARVIEDDEIIESQDERTALDRIFESEAAREEAYQKAERARDASYEQAESQRGAKFEEQLSNQAIDRDVTFNKSVSIEGDLSVKGKHYVVEANSLFVKDQFIACNFLEADKAEPGVRGTAGFLMISGAKDYNELGEATYPAYGIVYNYFKDCVLLGKGHINYIEYWKEQAGQYYVDFMFDEGEAQAIATRSDSIKNGNLVKWDAEQNKMVDAGVAPIDISSVADIPDGNLVKWDAENNKLVDAGTRIEIEASANAVPKRTPNGAILVPQVYGDLNYAASVRTAEMAQSFSWVDFYTSRASEYPYREGSFAAKGWQLEEPLIKGIMTGVPREIGKQWYQKVVNASLSNNTLIVKDALVFTDEFPTLARMTHIFTEKVVEIRNEGNDLYVTIAPLSSICINCRIHPQKGFSQIYIT